jgi:hypothetical protein
LKIRKKQSGISLGAKLKISNLSSSVRFRYPAPSFAELV